MANEWDTEAEEQDLYEHLALTVDKGQAPLRIDKFLVLRIENATRNKLQAALSAGSVTVNGQPVKANYKVKPLDKISVVLAAPPRDTEIYPENIPLDIVYEDEALLVINKPAGMVVHPGYGNYSGTLVNGLVYHFSQLPTMPGNTGRPGLVHRIDKDTSGLLLISKTDEAIAFLAQQFYNHSIQREYVALVWGNLTEDGKVEGYIGRSAADRKVMAVYDDESKGKYSLTHYRVLENFGYVTLIACRLETGRTHQIRAHMRHIGHPLFGDATYGGNCIVKGMQGARYKQFAKNALAMLPRQALHAKELGFIHPVTRQHLLFSTELPEDMQAVIHKWRQYANTYEQ